MRRSRLSSAIGMATDTSERFSSVSIPLILMSIGKLFESPTRSSPHRRFHGEPAAHSLPSEQASPESVPVQDICAASASRCCHADWHLQHRPRQPATQQHQKPRAYLLNARTPCGGLAHKAWLITSSKFELVAALYCDLLRFLQAWDRNSPSSNGAEALRYMSQYRLPSAQGFVFTFDPRLRLISE